MPPPVRWRHRCGRRARAHVLVGPASIRLISPITSQESLKSPNFHYAVPAVTPARILSWLREDLRLPDTAALRPHQRAVKQRALQLLDEQVREARVVFVLFTRYFWRYVFGLTECSLSWCHDVPAHVWQRWLHLQPAATTVAALPVPAYQYQANNFAECTTCMLHCPAHAGPGARS